MDFAHNRSRRTVAAMICSALLFYFGTGLTPIAALAWLAPLPVLLVATRVSGKAAAGVAFLACGLGMTNSWGWYLHSHDMPLLPWGLVITVSLSLTFVVAVWIFRRLLLQGHALLAATTAPAFWTAVLYLVSEFNPMGIQGTLATTQGDVPVVLQTAFVAGAWGVEYLVFLLPAAIAALTASTVDTAARIRTAVLATVLLTMALAGGAARLANGGNTGPSQRIALIASNEKGWAADLRTPAGPALLAGYLDQIAALPDGVSTVVLPEAAFGSDEAAPAALVDPVRNAAKTYRIDIVVGYAWWDGPKKYNLALTFPADGSNPVTYLKHHDTVSPPGHELVLPPTSGMRMGVEICMDVNFRDPSQGYANAGTRLLAIPASDEDASGWQHSRTALLRGVENGQAIAWSGRQTELMISDGWGRVLASKPTGGAGPFTTIVADVPSGPGATLYTRLGDWFGWLCLALALVGLFAASRSRQSIDSVNGPGISDDTKALAVAGRL